MLEEARLHLHAGRFAEAAPLFATRADAGGDGEEAWYARWQYARCLRDLGDEGGFLRQALMAFNQRPQRAEPLYDLARFYRERSMNDASVLFCEAGLALPRPEPGAGFVEEFVYSAGLREEYSIAANYARDPARKERGYAACNWLALNREIPSGPRDLARANLGFYAQPASAMMPSLTARPIGFTAPEGRRPMNPSVARWGDQIVAVLRTVNYTVTEDGKYERSDGARHTSQNFLLWLNHKLEVESSGEILPPADLPEPAFDDHSAFGDLRLFAWRDGLWCSACYRELTPEGWYEQVLARIRGEPPGPYRLTDWSVLRPEPPRGDEKNWMPQVAGSELRFIYRCDPTRVLGAEAQTIAERTPAIAADDFKGGSQAIPFEGGWLALVHEVRQWLADGRRDYRHRFVWFDAANVLRGVSRQFIFHKRGIEFAAGLAWHPDGERVLISYGVRDGEAWIATVQAEEVRQVLEDAERLASGTPASGCNLAQFPDPRQCKSAPPEARTMPRGRKVFDCVLYNGEVDALEIRLHELAAVVDRFVIVESDVTFSGLPRSIMYNAADPRVSPFASKITHVIVTDMPATRNAWERETWQRNAVLRGIPDAASDDLVLMSDVDEIPRASLVEVMRRDSEHRVFGLRLSFYYFYLNYRNVRGPEAALTWAVAAVRGELDKVTPDRLRSAARRGGHDVHILPDAGWHFSFLTDEAGIRKKIEAFSHQEWNTQSFLSSIDINATVRGRGDFFKRPSHVWDVVDELDLPSWVLQNRERLSHLFYSSDMDNKTLENNDMKRYRFSSDWFSRHIDTWHELLLTQKRRVSKVLEIGSYDGRATAWIMDNVLPGSGGEIFCVDLWENQEVEERFDHNICISLNKHEGVHVNKLKGLSAEVQNRLLACGHRNSFDLIYIDGSHEAPDVLIDLCYSFQLCKLGGLMICDDYLGGNWGHERDPIKLPKAAIDAFTNTFARKLSILEAPLYQVYLVKTAE